MNTQQITAGSVVVGVDGSPSSEFALRWAVDEALRTHQPLHVVHALEVEVVLSEKHPLGTEEVPASSDPVATAAMDVVATTSPEVQTTPHSITGFAPTTLIAASRVAGTVVLGSHGRGAIHTALLGSVTHQVAVHGHCPVVVVRENSAQAGVGSGRVVVGVDGSEASGPALGYAFAHAASTGCGILVVHTWWWEPLEGVNLGEGVILGEGWTGDWTQIANQEETLVAESLAGWMQKYPDVPVLRHVVRGDPVAELLEKSHGASLLVVGSRGRGGFIGMLLGSVSRRVLKRATCPVAVVRSVGADQPAT
ncbi:MAG: universal stress protein [Actinobacteria bacterium]|nr:universal stress protein [Actinomycetota bacterium]